GQEGYQLRHFLGSTCPADGNASKHVHNPLPCSVLADAASSGDVGDHSLCARGLDETGRNRRYSYSLRSNGLCQPLAVSSKGGLGRRVGESRIGERKTIGDGRNMNDESKLSSD